jgi:hypothetical protein
MHGNLDEGEFLQLLLVTMRVHVYQAIMILIGQNTIQNEYPAGKSMLK